MIHSTRCTIPVTSGWTDDQIYRAMARKLVNDIPLEELTRLIRFNKIDPRSSQFEDDLKNKKRDLLERADVAKLKSNNSVMYLAELRVK